VPVFLPAQAGEGRVILIDGILALPFSWAWRWTRHWAGGGPILPPGMCWSTTRAGRSARSSQAITDLGWRC